jgi:hypothetical protein
LTASVPTICTEDDGQQPAGEPRHPAAHRSSGGRSNRHANTARAINEDDADRNRDQRRNPMPTIMLAPRCVAIASAEPGDHRRDDRDERR